MRYDRPPSRKPLSAAAIERSGSPKPGQISGVTTPITAGDYMVEKFASQAKTRRWRSAACGPWSATEDSRNLLRCAQHRYRRDPVVSRSRITYTHSQVNRRLVMAGLVPTPAGGKVHASPSLDFRAASRDTPRPSGATGACRLRPDADEFRRRGTALSGERTAHMRYHGVAPTGLKAAGTEHRVRAGDGVGGVQTTGSESAPTNPTEREFLRFKVSENYLRIGRAGLVPASSTRPSTLRRSWQPGANWGMCPRARTLGRISHQHASARSRSELRALPSATIAPSRTRP